MRNKEVYQNKVTRLESMMNNIQRAVSSNDRQMAFEQIVLAKETLSDLQTMINREQTIYK